MASPGKQHCANCVGTLSFPKHVWSCYWTTLCVTCSFRQLYSRLCSKISCVLTSCRELTAVYTG